MDIQPRVIIVIPARGGSKRVPHKNIHPLAGKPLISHTIEAALAAGLGCPVYVSTDDEAIANVARTHVGVTVVHRPAEFAGDTASTESVLLHVLSQLPTSPEWVVTLPPTSPFRRPDTIRKLVDIALADAYTDCVMSLSENRGYFWREKPDGELVPLFPDASRRQQEREPLFEENSAVYVSKTFALRETGFILGKRRRGVAISAIEGFDINTADDLRMAEYIAANKE